MSARLDALGHQGIDTEGHGGPAFSHRGNAGQQQHAGLPQRVSLGSRGQAEMKADHPGPSSHYYFQQRIVQQTSEDVTAAVGDTADLQNATVLTLSNNDSLANERVLAVGNGLTLEDSGPGKRLTIRQRYVVETGGGYRLRMNLFADTEVSVPSRGTLMVEEAPLVQLVNAATDAAAAAAGVPVNGLYRNGGAVMVRLA